MVSLGNIMNLSMRKLKQLYPMTAINSFLILLVCGSIMLSCNTPPPIIYCQLIDLSVSHIESKYSKLIRNDTVLCSFNNRMQKGLGYTDENIPEVYKTKFHEYLEYSNSKLELDSSMISCLPENRILKMVNDTAIYEVHRQLGVVTKQPLISGNKAYHILNYRIGSGVGNSIFFIFELKNDTWLITEKIDIYFI